MSPQIATRLRRMLAVAVWVLVIGGLFAMHGLGGHGAGTHDGMTMSAVSSADHAGHAWMAHQADMDEPAAPAVDSGADDGGGMGLIILCVAILAAALAVFALVLLRHLGRRPLCTLPRGFLDLVVVGRDPDPPDLLRLSVMRC
jgi:hypothetical protein